MDDDDTILIMYPRPGSGGICARDAIRCNTDRLSDAQGEKIEQPVLEQPENSPTTQPPTPEGETIEDGPSYRLTFTAGARTSFGFVVGSHERCDFTVESNGVISGYHFAFQFDDEYRLVAKDLNSSRGTSVIYGARDIGPRVGRGWILSGCQFTSWADTIVISISPFCQFLVKIPQRDITSPEYRSKVDSFRRGTSVGAADLLRDLGIRSRAPTAQPSAMATPSRLKSRPVFRDLVGRGAFAIVYRVWDAETGEEFVVKRPRDKNRYNAEAWQREGEILSKTDHRNIVQLIRRGFIPYPVLHLEYVWGGSLANHLAGPIGFSIFETGEVLRQSTDVLMYLEENKIVHRDVSAHNILVSERARDRIFIKFTDFGLSKEAQELNTFCGHAVYLAPEIANISRPVYTSAVDVWSAGVVIAQLLCGLPDVPNNWFRDRNPTWPDDIRQRVSDYHYQAGGWLAPFLLSDMLVIDPAGRSPAALCYEKASRFPPGSKTSRPRQISRADWGEETIRPDTVGDGEDTISDQDADTCTLDFEEPDFQSMGTTAMSTTTTLTEAVPVGRDPAGVQFFFDKAMNPENSFFMGLTMTGMEDFFDIRDETLIPSVVSVATEIAGQGRSPPAALAVRQPTTLPSPVATPAAADNVEMPPPKDMALGGLYDPTRPITLHDVSRMWDEMEAEEEQESQKGGQKRIRVGETDAFDFGSVPKLRRSATSGPEDEPLSKRSRQVDDEDSE